MKRSFLLLLLILLIILVGCGDKTTSSSSESKLVVGMTHASPPNAFINNETEEPDGVMIDIVKAVAERAGYELEFEPMPFSSLIPSLESGRIDMISAGMGITDERAEVVSFTDPVYSFTEALVVPAGNPEGIQSLEDLENKSIGVSSGTFYHDYLVDHEIKMDVKAYDTVSEMLLDLTQGRINAAINDTPITKYLNENNPDYDVEIVDEYEANFLVSIGLIVDLENKELLDELNELLNELKSDGTLEKIHEKWGTTWSE